MILKTFIEDKELKVLGYNTSLKTYQVKEGEGRTSTDVARLSKLNVMYVVFDKNVEEDKDFIVLTAGAAEWVTKVDDAGQHLHSFYDLDVVDDADGTLWLQKPRDLQAIWQLGVPRYRRTRKGLLCGYIHTRNLK